MQILDEAIEASVKLSHRYIPARPAARQGGQPDRHRRARVAVSQHAVPAEVDDCRRGSRRWKPNWRSSTAKTASAWTTKRAWPSRGGTAQGEQERLAGLEKHWNEEKELVDKVLDIRGKLRAQGRPGGRIQSRCQGGRSRRRRSGRRRPPRPRRPAPPRRRRARTPLLAELAGLQDKLAELQGENPLIFPSVDASAIASVVADWTGIPVGRMVKNEIEQVLNLADILERRVIGQRHALETIARRIQTSRARLDNPNRPIGVFMLVGPCGTGKTETALTLAEALYGGEQNLITINMSEFQEAHTVSTLKGSPPGYVGYGEGGVLTEAVRRRPYSVVLLDEVEKAHPDVHEIFFQVFDKGWMEDAEGRYIDFKNTIILLTSNAAQDVIINMCKDPELMPDAEAWKRHARPADQDLPRRPAEPSGGRAVLSHQQGNAEAHHQAQPLAASKSA